jgi:hypothetical protein
MLLLKEPGNISGYDRDNYHSLCRALCQRVAVPKVVDFNIFDIVSIGHVDVAVEFGGWLDSGGGGLSGGTCGLIA